MIDPGAALDRGAALSLDCYKYYENIQRYILSQTDAAYAEDLTQDVFEEFIRRNPDPAGIKNPEAIRMRLIEGLDSRKAAQVAGCSVETLYRRCYEGVKAIRKKMWHMGKLGST